jgi:hypothetical protein
MVHGCPFLDTHGSCRGFVPSAWDLVGDDQFLFLSNLLDSLAARASYYWFSSLWSDVELRRAWFLAVYRSVLLSDGGVAPSVLEAWLL